MDELEEEYVAEDINEQPSSNHVSNVKRKRKVTAGVGQRLAELNEKERKEKEIYDQVMAILEMK